LLEAGTLVWVGCKQRFPAKNARALRFKECAQLRGEKRRTVLSPVELQEETSVRFEKSCSDIVDEKFPIGERPFEPFSVFGTREPVKTNAVAGYKVEFSSEIGQRRLRFDAPNDAVNIEELGCPAEKRLLICVKPESFVTEESAEIEKVTGAATKIENLQWWGTIEPKILRTPDVYADPVRCIFVSIDLSRIWPVGITLA
jgi:hypothetical protein